MNGILDFITGGGQYADPNAMHPVYGVPQSDVRQALLNSMMSAGASLLAAGQPIAPAQRAQLLGQAGAAFGNVGTDVYNAAQRRLMQQQFEMRRGEMADIANIARLQKEDPARLASMLPNVSPDVIATLSPQQLRQIMGAVTTASATRTPEAVERERLELQALKYAQSPEVLELNRQAKLAEINARVNAGTLSRLEAERARAKLEEEKRQAEAMRSYGFGQNPPAAAPTAVPAAPSGIIGGEPVGLVNVPAASQVRPATQAPVSPPAPGRPSGWVLTPEQERLIMMAGGKMPELIAANRAEIRAAGESQKERFTQEGALRTDFDKLAVPFEQRQAAYKTMMSLAEQGQGASDAALVLSLMKVYDPTSTVTAGEAATIQNASGVPEWVRSMFNRALGGGALSQEARDQIVNAARQRFTQELDAYSSGLDRYRGLAERYGLKPENVINDVRDPDIRRAREVETARAAASREVTPEQILNATAEQLDSLDMRALTAAQVAAVNARRAQLARPARPAPAEQPEKGVLGRVSVSQPGQALAVPPQDAAQAARVNRLLQSADLNTLLQVDVNSLTAEQKQLLQQRLRDLGSR